MPFTPLRSGPASLVGPPLRERVHVPALLGSVIADTEPLAVSVLNLDLPMHGYLGSFLLAVTTGLAVGYFTHRIEATLGGLYGALPLEPGELGLGSFLAAGTLRRATCC